MRKTGTTDMCDFCNNSIPEIETTITDAAGSKVYCPNDLIVQLVSGQMDLKPIITLVDEVFKRPGAVKVEDKETTYVLTPQSARRLINHSLSKFELAQLMRNRGCKDIPAGSEYYQIHDDFYASDGTAIQPCVSNLELNDLYEGFER